MLYIFLNTNLLVKMCVNMYLYLTPILILQWQQNLGYMWNHWVRHLILILLPHLTPDEVSCWAWRLSLLLVLKTAAHQETCQLFGCPHHDHNMLPECLKVQKKGKNTITHNHLSCYYIFFTVRNISHFLIFSSRYNNYNKKTICTSTAYDKVTHKHLMSVFNTFAP